MNFQGMCTRREKLYALSEWDLYGFCGGTHGSTGDGKTPLADVARGVIGQQVRVEAKVMEKMPQEDQSLRKEGETLAQERVQEQNVKTEMQTLVQYLYIKLPHLFYETNTEGQVLFINANHIILKWKY